MSIESDPSLFDPEEMKLYGFDPESPTDQQEWLLTTPPYGTPVFTDYSQDQFEFGNPDHQPAQS